MTSEALQFCILVGGVFAALGYQIGFIRGQVKEIDLQTARSRAESERLRERIG